ncbi:MAG TPA: hypothetical protein VGN83_06985 [Falsiroseomonas sp.]|nr:hypothetical protein [Falsiroseomonas sp.]
MTDRDARAARNQERSPAAFLKRKAEFDALLAELQQASDNHFGADPEAVLWGVVGGPAALDSLGAERGHTVARQQGAGGLDGGVDAGDAAALGAGGLGGRIGRRAGRRGALGLGGGGHGGLLGRGGGRRRRGAAGATGGVSGMGGSS